jgi:hypothetical protein
VVPRPEAPRGTAHDSARGVKLRQPGRSACVLAGLGDSHAGNEGAIMANGHDPEAITNALDHLHRAGWSIGSTAFALAAGGWCGSCQVTTEIKRSGRMAQINPWRGGRRSRRVGRSACSERHWRAGRVRGSSGKRRTWP